MNITVRYCSKTKFGNTRRTVLALKKILKAKQIMVCEEYFYAHMLRIDEKIEEARAFGKKMSATD